MHDACTRVDTAVIEAVERITYRGALASVEVQARFQLPNSPTWLRYPQPSLVGAECFLRTRMTTTAQTAHGWEPRQR